MHWLLCCLLESPLLELHFFGEFASLNIRQQEGLNKIFDKSFIIVVSSLETLQMLIHLFLSEIGHDTGLTIWSSLHCISNNPVEVTIYSTLVHFYNLFIETLFTSSDDLFSISSTCFLDFSISPLFLGLFHFLLNFFLLSNSNQFFWKLI